MREAGLAYSSTQYIRLHAFSLILHLLAPLAMTVTLYQPGQTALPVDQTGFALPVNAGGQFASVPPQAAVLLGCAPNLVDVLANRPVYVVYTVFDCDDEANPTAMQAVAELTGISFDATNEDELLRGAVLIVAS